MADLTSWHNKRAAIGLLLCLLLSVGCGSVATKKGFYEAVTVDLEANRFDAAVQRIEKARADDKYGEKDRFVYYLDAGLAYHWLA